MLDGEDMLAPEMIEGLEQDSLLDLRHDFRGIFLALLGVDLVDSGANPLADFLVGDPFFLGPFLDRRIKRQQSRASFSRRPAASHCSA